MDDFVERIEFDPETGLVPAVVQSTEDGRVVMLAYMDEEALRRTVEGGRVTFWSRSRGELWEKGETSGNWLETREVRADCDRDALLVRARPHGPACHTGEESCFDAGPARRPAAGADGPGGGADGEVAEGVRSSGGAAGSASPGSDARPRRPSARPVPAPPGDAGGGDLSDAGPSPAPVLASVLEEVVRVVADRDRERPEGSYTVRLLEGGAPTAARKVGEEALEVALTAVEEPAGLRRLAEESADLLYHLAVLWRAAELDPDGVGRVLAERRAGGEG